MSELNRKTMFKSMNVGAIKKYLQERGVTVNGYLKPALVEIASAVEKMVHWTRILSVIMQEYKGSFNNS